MTKDNKKIIIRNSTAEFLIFTSQAGEDNIEVRVQDENVWLTQKLIAKLFDVKIPTINEHLKNIFEVQELNENSVIRDFLITATDGKSYKTKHYNLEVIISLGYRINSQRATDFRKWATRVLKDFDAFGEECEKFISIHKPESKYVPYIKNYLKAYVTNEHFRNEINNQRFPREYVGFTMPEYQALNGYRQTVPEYVKDYVPVNTYMR